MPLRSTPLLPTKSHYEILDGLRGVAALLIVIFHMFEAFSGGNHQKQILNHGYLAVDFFFLLSGFVVAYAYDDRWGRMNQWDFYKRRLIRLQPMVILGSVLGAAFFYVQGGPVFPLIHGTPVGKLLLVMLFGCTLLPLPIRFDIRGWAEMHPLDGPAWSLFFEYTANILYAVGVRKLPKKALGVLVFASAALLLHFAVTNPRGDMTGGWSLNQEQLSIGFTRLFYPFFAGMLLMRLGKRIHIRYPFAVCSVLLAIVLCLPRIGGSQYFWMNGLYEALCIIFVFPLIVAVGAGDRFTGAFETKVCQWLGGISYPLYITHYVLIYWYTEWVIRDKVPAREGVEVGFVLFVTAIAIAYASLKLYDEPLRRWLSRRFLARPA